MTAFQKRLLRTMRAGNLRVADLARWFDRPDPTVRGWTNGVAPGAAPQDMTDVEARLARLERLIETKRGFPLPPRLRPSDRIALLARAAAAQ